ncbi:MAG: HAD family hydrolase [Acidobacteriota bacterium]
MTAVVFDYGGTLAGWTSFKKSLTSIFEHELAEPIGESLDQRVAAALLGAPDEQPDWQGIWQETFRDFDLPFEPELAELHLRAYAESSPIYEMAAGVLAELRFCGVKTALLADVVGPTEIFQRVLEEHGLADRFDAIVWSSETGVRKPASAAFEHVADALAMHPTQLIMVGDSEEQDITPARDLGWRTVRVYSSGAIPQTEADFVVRNRDLPTLFLGPRSALLQRLSGV